MGGGSNHTLLFNLFLESFSPLKGISNLSISALPEIVSLRSANVKRFPL